MYVIFPAAMLAAFLVFYSQERQHLEQVDQERQAAVAKQKADDDARQAMLQEKARQESEAHAAEQAKEAAQREADRLAKHRAEIAGFQAQVDKATADIAVYASAPRLAGACCLLARRVSVTSPRRRYVWERP